MAEAYVGERHEFPMVVAKVSAYDLETMRTIGTSGLRQTYPRFICSGEPTTDVVNGTRRCGTCGEIKAIDQFPRDVTKLLGRGYVCTSCEQSQRKFPDGGRGVTDFVNQTRRCMMCREVKHLDEYHRDKSDCAGRTRRCKPCQAKVKRDLYYAAKPAA